MRVFWGAALVKGLDTATTGGGVDTSERSDVVAWSVG